MSRVFFWIFEKGDDGKLRYLPGSWKRLFKVDIKTLLVLVIILQAFLYQTDTDRCREVFEEPEVFCEESVGCACIANQEQPFTSNISYEVDEDLPGG